MEHDPHTSVAHPVANCLDAAGQDAQLPLAFRDNFTDHARRVEELRERMLMEPVAEQSPRTGRRGPFGFFTMRAASHRDSPASPSLADMEEARMGLQRRLRSPRLRLIDAAGATLQRLPLMLPAVARVTVAVLRRETRAEP